MPHAIGDSHAAFASPFITHSYPSSTAHNLISDTSATEARKHAFTVLAEMERGETVLLIFGEVDCRVHIRDEAMARETVERYGRFIREVRDLGFAVIVQSVVGAVPQGNVYERFDYPSVERRGSIVLMFNRLLAEWCGENGIRFFDIGTADERGILPPHMTNDQVHLSNAAPYYAQLYAQLTQPGGN